MKRRIATASMAVGLLGLVGAAPVAAWTSGDQSTAAPISATSTWSVDSMTTAAGTPLTNAEMNAAVQEFLTKLMADIQQLLSQLQAAAPASAPAVAPVAVSTTKAQTSATATDPDGDNDTADVDGDHDCDRISADSASKATFASHWGDDDHDGWQRDGDGDRSGTASTTRSSSDDGSRTRYRRR
jgi:hypothetical protein